MQCTVQTCYLLGETEQCNYVIYHNVIYVIFCRLSKCELRQTLVIRASHVA